MKAELRRVGIVMQREYLQRVRKKSFIVSTIAFPLVMILSILIPVLIAARQGGDGNQVVLIDRSGVLAEALARRLEEGGLTVEIVPPDSPRMDSAFAEAREGEISGVLEVDSTSLATGGARWSGEDAPSALRRMSVAQAVSQTALALRLEGAVGAEEASEIRSLVEGGEVEFISLDEEEIGEGRRLAGAGAGFAGGMLLYIAILSYGTMVMRSVQEEKNGRVAEVILSSMHPRELMLGKIFGVGSVGFTQMGIWVGTSLLLASAGLPFLLAMLPPEITADLGVIEAIRGAAPAIGVVFYFLLCFVLGFLTYASLFTAVGAMCSTEEEAAQMAAPLIMMVFLPIFLIMPVLRDPVSTFSTLISLFPLFSPILMFARVASGAAPLWQAALAIVLMGGTLFLAATAAGKIYRTGILMTGKRPNLPEILRWVREG